MEYFQSLIFFIISERKPKSVDLEMLLQIKSFIFFHLSRETSTCQ